jgi:hypothetical protein
MTAFEGFLLGLMVSWIPSVIFLGCIAFGTAPEDSKRQSHLRSSPQQLNA